MIFVTGDCHGEFHKLSAASFPEQKQMSIDDTVIICGDFGAVWDADGENSSERYWLNWLNQKPFTTVFVDGNHENFDRLKSEFETVDFHGGKARKIRSNVYHLMRGEVFEFEGKRFFAFGGASSHDISDGILRREDFESEDKFKDTVRSFRRLRKEFRIDRVTWWAEELPSEEEIAHAEESLSKVGCEVDYVISHCAPQSIVSALMMGSADPDKLTMYFEDLAMRLKFKNWFFGHYHEDRKIMGKFIVLYDQIVRIV